MADNLNNKIEAFFYDELRQSQNPDATRTEPTPEHKLCIAVLARAIVDAVQPVDSAEWYESHRNSCKMDALRFFRRTSCEPFSFLWLCDVLAIDPDYLRHRIEITLKKNEPRETFCLLFPKRKRFLSWRHTLH